MKYEVGDKVKIKTWKQMADECGLTVLGNVETKCSFTTYMAMHCGKIMTIRNVCDGYYKMKEDYGCWTWSDDMFDDSFEDYERIKIKYHSDIPKIEKIEKGDWIDLRSAEDVELKHGEYKNISLGVSMELPDGYEAHILPRSSTFKNFGIILVNSMGIIDNSYNGDGDIWQFPALCLNPEGTHIKKGDRIAQFRIVENQPDILFDEVETLGNDDRGGIGSTGRR